MLIGIDGNEANIKNRVGVGQYAYNLLLNLHQIDSQNKYIIYLKEPPQKDLPQPNKNWEYRVFGPKKLWTKIALPLRLYTQKEKLDLFYSPSHYSPQFCPSPTIPTIHDLGYLKYPEQFTQKDLYQLVNWTKRSIIKSKKIITVSNFSKNEIKKEYLVPDTKINIAYNGVGEPPKLDQKEVQNTLKKFDITQPYFLYLGTLKPNKNIPFIVKSFAQFIKNQSKNQEYQLVIAGKKGWLFDEIFKTVQNEKVEKQVVFTDFITESEKWILYHKSIALILPSLYEGFGIPAIEAMKIGTPVIASNIEVLKEVIVDSGIFIDPTNINDLSAQMEKILQPQLRAELSKKGLKQAQKFTWQNTARSVINTFKDFN